MTGWQAIALIGPSLGFLITKVWRKKENLRNSLRIPGSPVVSTWHFHIHSIPWEN